MRSYGHRHGAGPFVTQLHQSVHKTFSPRFLKSDFRLDCKLLLAIGAR
jgi:hypothetical protein